MANFVVTDFVSKIDDLNIIMAEVETYLETVVNTQTILMQGVVKHGQKFQAFIIHGV